MSSERMGDEFSVFTFPFSDCHTPSGALLLVPLTQRDKVDEYLNLKLSPPSFPFSVFTFPFGIPLLSFSKLGEVPEGRRGL